MPPDHSVDPKSFAERKLTPAEADYELACFHIGTHDIANGRTLLEKSLATDPNLAAAHEELGYVNFDQGKDDDAQKEWKQALTLDPSLPRSLFALTMTGPSVHPTLPSVSRTTARRPAHPPACHPALTALRPRLRRARPHRMAAWLSSASLQGRPSSGSLSSHGAPAITFSPATSCCTAVNLLSPPPTRAT